MEPDTGVALSETELPAVTGFGLAEPVAVGGVEEPVTVSAMLNEALCDCASVTEHGSE